MPVIETLFGVCLLNHRKQAGQHNLGTYFLKEVDITRVAVSGSARGEKENFQSHVYIKTVRVSWTTDMHTN